MIIQVQIDELGKRTVRLTKTQIKVLERAKRLVAELERLGLSFPDPDTETLSGGLADLLALAHCQGEAQDEAEKPDVVRP